MKAPTHVVTHKRLYFTVALPGQKKATFQHVPQGTQLMFTKDQAKGYLRRGMIGPIGGEVATMPEGLEELKARAAELNLEGSAKWGKKRLTEEIAKAEEAIAAGNAAAGTK